MTTRNRRVLQWFTSNQNNTALLSDTQQNLLLYNAIVQGPRFIKGATVTRILLDLVIEADSVAQRNTMFWGIAVVNADARAAGAFPEADDVSDRAGWLGRGKLEVEQASLADSSQWGRTKLDLRSQRVLRNEEEELHLIIDAAATGFTLNWSAYVRVLMRLP